MELLQLALHRRLHVLLARARVNDLHQVQTLVRVNHRKTVVRELRDQRDLVVAVRLVHALTQHRLLAVQKQHALHVAQLRHLVHLLRHTRKAIQQHRAHALVQLALQHAQHGGRRDQRARRHARCDLIALWRARLLLVLEQLADADVRVPELRGGRFALAGLARAGAAEHADEGPPRHRCGAAVSVVRRADRQRVVRDSRPRGAGRRELTGEVGHTARCGSARRPGRQARVVGSPPREFCCVCCQSPIQVADRRVLPLQIVN